MVSIDQSVAIRAGEELPRVALLAYLTEHFPDLHGPLTIEQFPSGFSNLTYLLRIGDRELVLRRPPIGAKIKTAHDMSREYRILGHLHPVYGKVPRPLLFCEDEAVLGAPFYVMERVKGIILRAQPQRGLGNLRRQPRRNSQYRLRSSGAWRSRIAARIRKSPDCRMDQTILQRAHR